MISRATWKPLETRDPSTVYGQSLLAESQRELLLKLVFLLFVIVASRLLDDLLQEIDRLWVFAT